MKKNQSEEIMQESHDDNTENCMPYDNDESGLTIIEALDIVQEHARDSQLSPEFRKECSREISYLCRRLELTDEQVIIVAMMCETGRPMSWKKIGEFLGLSRLKTMSLTPALEGLQERRWVYLCAVNERESRYQGFHLVNGMIKAFRHNTTFEPEKIDGLSEQMFIDRLARYICCEGHDPDIPTEETHRWLKQLVEMNKHLPLCKEIMKLREDESKITLLLEVADYARFAGSEDEGLCLNELGGWFENGWVLDSLGEELQEGSQELFRRGLLEHGCLDGMVDTERYLLTKEAKESLLGGFKPHRRRKKKDMMWDRNIRKAKDIEQKTLYFNAGELSQLERLESLLYGDSLGDVQHRLSDCGLRRGITCLFYGAPGTGKTESVLQLARRSERDILQIDIAGLRDKFVGESEKNIKNVFNRYRDLCASSARMPILLFNEADAIINNRFETTRSSVEKMDNAMQNIILQELEDLDGILIATTNLTGTLDKAFDRRFLFKVEFERPEAETRGKIWHSMLPDLSEDACKTLAGEFDFSGGQIENIARKCKIEQAISGQIPTLAQLQEFCRQERLNRDSRARIGF